MVGGSNGGETEGIGVFVGDGRQLKGSVGGGGYRQPKKAKRRGECGGEWRSGEGRPASARGTGAVGEDDPDKGDPQARERKAGAGKEGKG